MGGNLVRILAASLFGFFLMLSTTAFADAAASTPTVPGNMNIKKGRGVSNAARREIEHALKELPDFDAKDNKVMQVFTWDGAAGPGMIVADREGVGRSAGCAIYEKIGNSVFELVNGQPFCWLSSSSGEFNRKSSSIRFKGKIRQSYDSPLNDMWFDLFYDAHTGIFCDPSSRSKKFRCGESFSRQGADTSSGE
ncbi:hypothetical protein [Burkholderia glumae]|uniref:hypothetical protein n=1 Tax=Burkholderia glumae TaxID=337 RepID=UPI0015884CFD|nr:hypothetical protein [Burkholderia glumae]